MSGWLEGGFLRSAAFRVIIYEEIETKGQQASTTTSPRIEIRIAILDSVMTAQ